VSLERLGQLLWEAGIPIRYIEGDVSAPIVVYVTEGPAAATPAQMQQGAAIVAAFPQTLANEAAAAAAAVANESTLRQQAEQALASNKTRRDQLVAWRTTGPGAGTTNLTAAQSSLAMRTMADNQAAMLQQLNGIIRLVLRKLDGID
jgi:hypothetical protein